jgi:hypothetical protein
MISRDDSPSRPEEERMELESLVLTMIFDPTEKERSDAKRKLLEHIPGAEPGISNGGIVLWFEDGGEGGVREVICQIPTEYNGKEISYGFDGRPQTYIN